MFQFEDLLGDLFTNPDVLRYLVGGIVVLIVIIVCYSIHNRLMKS